MSAVKGPSRPSVRDNGLSMAEPPEWLSRDDGLSMAEIVKPGLIKTVICKLPAADPRHDYAVGFEGLDADEARTLIDMVIKLEQARTGDILSPTEYGDRFSGIDIG